MFKTDVLGICLSSPWLFFVCFMFLLFRHFAGSKFRTSLLSKSHSKLLLCLWLHINGDHNSACLELITRLSILLLDERSTGTSRVRRRRVTGHTGRISVQGIWLDAELPSQLLKGNFVLRKNTKKWGMLTSNECVGVHQRTGFFFPVSVEACGLLHTECHLRKTDIYIFKK